MDDLSFSHLRGMNRLRCYRWHPDQGVDSWTLNDWATAVAGELGEACNICKKIKRAEDAVVGNKKADSVLKLRANLADEMADTVIYLDLMAAKAGVNLGQAVTSKFNRKSNELGFPEKLRPIALTEVDGVLAEVATEREWRDDNLEEPHSKRDWSRLLSRQLATVDMGGRYRHGLLRLIALAVAAIEQLDKGLSDDCDPKDNPELVEVNCDHCHETIEAGDARRIFVENVSAGTDHVYHGGCWIASLRAEKSQPEARAEGSDTREPGGRDPSWLPPHLEPFPKSVERERLRQSMDPHHDPSKLSICFRCRKPIVDGRSHIVALGANFHHNCLWNAIHQGRS